MQQSDALGGAARLARDGASVLAELQYRGLQAVLAALDHLIDQHEWARARLVSHAGRQLELALDPPAPGAWVPPPLRLRVTDDGRLEAVKSPDEVADAGTEAASRGATSPAAVRMTLKPSVDAAFAFMTAGPAGLQRHLRIEGDVLFAAALGELAQGLRWDAEEDLSRWVGDVAAHRIMSAGRQVAESVKHTREHAMQSAARFATTESQALVSRQELELHREELLAMERRLSALERR